MDYSEIAKRNTENQDNYILSEYGTFDKFYDEIKEGSTIVVPIDCLVPRTKREWDEAAPGLSQTDELIEVTFDKLVCDESSRKAEFVIWDGHNRYKDKIDKGEKHINVRIKNV